MREKLIAITIDYETWNPLPPGNTVDWNADIFRPAEQLMELGELCSAPITFFAEMGEYFWLEHYEPRFAERMAAQLREVVSRRHDVQLHLHPNWLPEAGAKFENGQWWWDPSLQVPGLYPGDLTVLIARCKAKLEDIARAAKPDYRVTCFRCGGYSAQPFDRVYDALAANGIYCDSSVYLGGRDAARKYDFRFARSEHQPYYADRFDPQLRAPEAERSVIELPIFAWQHGHRWCLDGDGAKALDAQFLNYQARVPNSSSIWLRTIAKLFELTPWPTRLRRVLERNLRRHLRVPSAEDSLLSDYFVMIGHTKTRLEFEALRRAIEELRSLGCRFESLDFLAERARGDVERIAAEPGWSKVVSDPKMFSRSCSIQLASSNEFADRIPLDRKRILLWRPEENRANPIAKLRPWATVTEYDSVGLGGGTHSAMFSHFANEVFDCVHGPHLLESHPDPNKLLAEAYRVLTDGGLFLTILPRVSQEGALFPQAAGSEAAAKAILDRMKRAGFVNAAVSDLSADNEFYFPNELRTRRRFRDAARAALRNITPWSRWLELSERFLLLSGWKRPQTVSPFDRVLEMMSWVYRVLSPGAPGILGPDPHALVREERGLCIDYCIVLGAMLRNEGFDVEWVTMAAHNHPCGSGAEKRDTHEVLRVRVEGRTSILDPMTNNWYEADLQDLLRCPALATRKSPPDQRYIERSYALYDTAEWYARVVEYMVRKDIALFPWMIPWRRNPWRAPLREPTAGAESGAML